MSLVVNAYALGLSSTLMAPGRPETTIDHNSSPPLRGTVEIESAAVPYIDVRAEHAEAVLGEIDRFVRDIEQLASTGTPSLRGLAIAAPQPSDALALSLAPRGIMLIVGNPLDPLLTLLDQFKERLNVIRSADPQGVWRAVSGRTGIGTCASTSAEAPMTGPRTESMYAQRPPWFNQAGFDERLRQLQQPWRDEDAWKSDT
jgi:hypothetical protein